MVLAPEVRSALFVNLLTEDNLAVLLPHHRGRLRAGQRLGRVEPAVDGRGGSPLDRHPRLPHRHPGHRPRRPRAGPHGPGQCGQVPEPESPQDAIAYVALQELRHPHRPPQHRQARRRPGRLRGAEAGGQRREPPLPLLPRPRHRRPRARPVRDARRHRAPGADFEMPGTGIVDFVTHAKAIAAAGIYDFQIHHDQILEAGRRAPLGRSRRSRASTTRARRPGARPCKYIWSGRQGRQAPRPPPRVGPGLNVYHPEPTASWPRARCFHRDGTLNRARWGGSRQPVIECRCRGRGGGASVGILGRTGRGFAKPTRPTSTTWPWPSLWFGTSPPAARR